MSKNQNEPLLAPDDNRFVMFPIKYQDIWEMYKKQLACFWIATEIDFSKDRTDWKNKLNVNERYFIKNILAFFAGSDGIVGVNILNNFSKELIFVLTSISSNKFLSISGSNVNVNLILKSVCDCEYFLNGGIYFSADCADCADLEVFPVFSVFSGPRNKLSKNDL